jgi:hypothetical protein
MTEFVTNAVFLPFRQASQGAEIRMRGPDTSHAGGIGLQTTQLQGVFMAEQEGIFFVIIFIYVKLDLGGVGEQKMAA